MIEVVLFLWAFGATTVAAWLWFEWRLEKDTVQILLGEVRRYQDWIRAIARRRIR